LQPIQAPYQLQKQDPLTPNRQRQCEEEKRISEKKWEEFIMNAGKTGKRNKRKEEL
jgi:hypothetical protein